MNRPAFIVIGHGRSGTAYMAALMRYFGYNVAHETCGNDGISAMDALPDSPTNFGIDHDKKSNRLIYHGNPNTKLIHVVRNPWLVVQSAAGVDGVGGAHNVSNLWYPHNPEMQKAGITRVCYSVVIVNKTISNLTRDLVVQVERAPDIVTRWLKNNGLFTGTKGNLPRTNTGHKDHPPLTNKDWGSVEAPAIEKLKAHALEYGYEDSHP